ncbi:unnamed protein product [Mytilus coruscus]|uniref:Uncharacterized protein n=1 Tax=Mytilus coruscus TaxID=42192 RepID=A0A6J8DKK3_MYTCO|nr:unnamed protein product [Mytilus coruscus]
MAQVLKPNCSLVGKSLIPIILRVKTADAEAILEFSRLKNDEPLESLPKVELIAQFEKLTGSDGKAAPGDPSTTNQQLQAMRQDLDELKKNSNDLQVDEALSYVRTLAARPKLSTPGVLLAAIKMLVDAANKMNHKDYWAKSKKYEEPSGSKERQNILDAPPASASVFPFPGYGYQNPGFGFPYLIFILGQTIIRVVFRLPECKEVENIRDHEPLVKKEKFEPEIPDWDSSRNIADRESRKLRLSDAMLRPLKWNFVEQRFGPHTTDVMALYSNVMNDNNGDRANDLGLCISQEVKLLPSGDDFLFSHTVGKTLGKGKVNEFSNLRFDDTLICPVRALERYVEGARALGVDLRFGYLFRTLSKNRKDVTDNPVSSNAMYDRLRKYLETRYLRR